MFTTKYNSEIFTIMKLLSIIKEGPMSWMSYIPEVMILNQYYFQSKIIYSDNIHTTAMR